LPSFRARFLLLRDHVSSDFVEFSLAMMEHV